jgi:dipeptidyl aminopeptidase/acylaminoacyl peptidase
MGLVSTNSASDSIPLVKRLTYEIKLDSPQWSKDGGQIFARRDYGAYKQIYAIDAKTGKPKQITNAPLNIENYSLSPDGLQLAWIGQDAQATRVIRIASSDGQNVQDLATIPGASHDMALSEVREIDWKTPDYPTRMRGLLFLPLNYREGVRYPLIVDIHGGDVGAHIYMMGGILVTTPLEWHMWTAKGYAVFVPEFRSSASFGSLAVTRDHLQEYNRLGGDLKDIEAGVDELVARGIADDQRLAIIGHSAGSVRANWFTVSTHRYRAIVSKEGWADEFISALKDPPSKRRYSQYGGSPWEVPQNYLKNSSLYHSAGATTPTLFFMGNPKLGGVDEFGTVNLLYHAIKAQGVETNLIQYSDEGHVYEQPANRRDVLERSVQWIDAHMGVKDKTVK